jgi:hypothetical protein
MLCLAEQFKCAHQLMLLGKLLPMRESVQVVYAQHSPAAQPLLLQPHLRCHQLCFAVNLLLPAEGSDNLEGLRPT